MKELIEKVKCSIFLRINEHKTYYQTAEEYITERKRDYPEEFDDVPKEVLDKMINNNVVMQLDVYPDTPIGFFTFYGADFDDLIKQAIKILDSYE